MKPAFAFAAFILGLTNPALASIDVQFAAGARPGDYGKVLIAPAQVRFHRDFLTDMNPPLGQAKRLSQDEADRIARDMGESFRVALIDAFKARGVDVTPTPGSDVLTLVPVLDDLYINAPEGSTAGMSKSYVREAGRATMRVEGRDAQGARVVFAEESGTTGRIVPFSPASDVSNRFWFEKMFRRWADDLAVALHGAK